MPRVVAKQQISTCPRVISEQRTDSGLMAVLQRTATPRVVANKRTYLTSQATSAQQTDSNLMTMLQQTATPRVVARPQANISPVAKSAHPCRQNTLRLGGNANHTPERREVRMIFGGPREVRDSRGTRDIYSQKAKRLL